MINKQNYKFKQMQAKRNGFVQIEHGIEGAPKIFHLQNWNQLMRALLVMSR